MQAQIQAIETSKLLIATDTNRGLTNPFSKKEAREGQHHDLLNFRSIGQQECYKFRLLFGKIQVFRYPIEGIVYRLFLNETY